MVSLLTGEVYIEEEDFVIPGLFDLWFLRNYISSSRYEGALGYGWYHSFDQVITYDNDNNILYRNDEGFTLKFDYIKVGENTKNEESNLLLHRNKLGYSITFKFGISLLFENSLDNITYKLTRIEDKYKNGITLFFNDQSQLLRIEDSLNRTIIFEYESKKIKKIFLQEDPKVKKFKTLMEYNYNDQGDLITAIDVSGNTTKYSYSNHLLVKTTDKENHSTFYVYDDYSSNSQCISTSRDNKDHSTVYYFDSENLITTVTNSLGSKIQYKFNNDGSTKEIIDKFGFIRFEYSSNDHENEIRVTNGLETTVIVNNEKEKEYKTIDTYNNHFSIKWNDRYDQVILKDELAGSIIINFNQNYYISSITNEVGETEEFVYDNKGMVRKFKLSNGNIISYDRDESSRNLKISDDLGIISIYTFDYLNAITSYTDALGNQWKYEYYENQKLKKIISPNGYEWFCLYNKEGKLIEENNYDGKYYYKYLNDLPVSVEEDLGAANKFEYKQGKVSTIVNPLGLRYEIYYDERYRVKKEKPFGSAGVSYEYDKFGNRIAMKSSLYSLNAYYDKVGNVLKIHDDHNLFLEYQYDERSMVKNIKTNNSEINISYDKAYRIIKEIQNKFVIEYDYDNFGELKKIKDSLGGLILLFYDKRGRCIKIIDNNKNEYLFKYDIADNLIERSVGSVFREKLGYDFNGNLISQIVSINDNVVLTRKYCYYINGELRQIEDSKRGTLYYEYDKNRRLTTVSKNGNIIEEYIYDPANNILSAPWSNNKQIILSNGIHPKQISEVFLEYDSEGNLRSISNNDSKKYFNFDSFGQLIKISYEDVEIKYTYDGLARRINKNRGDNNVDFFWMFNTLYAEWDGKTLKRYIPYPVDKELGVYDLLAISDETSTNICISDHLGTPIEFYNSDGETTWEAEYESFGRIKKCVSKIMNPIRLPGQYHDEETGLYYNRFRYYNPNTGYYISADPKKDLFNLHPFRYGHPNPVMTNDPLGLGVGRPGARENMKLIKQAIREIESSGISPHTLPGPPLFGTYREVKKYIKKNGLQGYHSGHILPDRFLNPDGLGYKIFQQNNSLLPADQFTQKLKDAKKMLEAIPMRQNFNCGLYKRLENALFDLDHIGTANIPTSQMCKRVKLLAKFQNTLLGEGVGDRTLALFRNLGLPCV